MMSQIAIDIRLRLPAPRETKKRQTTERKTADSTPGWPENPSIVATRPRTAWDQGGVIGDGMLMNEMPDNIMLLL